MPRHLKAGDTLDTFKGYGVEAFVEKLEGRDIEPHRAQHLA